MERAGAGHRASRAVPRGRATACDGAGRPRRPLAGRPRRRHDALRVRGSRLCDRACARAGTERAPAEKKRQLTASPRATGRSPSGSARPGRTEEDPLAGRDYRRAIQLLDQIDELLDGSPRRAGRRVVAFGPEPRATTSPSRRRARGAVRHRRAGEARDRADDATTADRAPQQRPRAGAPLERGPHGQPDATREPPRLSRRPRGRDRPEKQLGLALQPDGDRSRRAEGDQRHPGPSGRRRLHRPPGGGDEDGGRLGRQRLPHRRRRVHGPAPEQPQLARDQHRAQNPRGDEGPLRRARAQHRRHRDDRAPSIGRLSSARRISRSTRRSGRRSGSSRSGRGWSPRDATPRAGGFSPDQRTLAAALARTVDARDPGTSKHSETVAELADRNRPIRHGIRRPRLERLRVAALLHDVGKIGVARRDPAQAHAARDERGGRDAHHVVVGRDILAAAGFVEEATWVYHHHEHFDGTGYPGPAAERARSRWSRGSSRSPTPSR